jgi:hypothetical protein
VGFVARRGLVEPRERIGCLVEPREGIGWPFLCWVVVAVECRMGIGCRQCRSVRLAGRSVTLQAVGPAAGGVVDARNLDFRVAHAVGNNVGRFGYHQFTRAGDAAGCAEFRIFHQQVFDAIEDVQGDALCGGRVMFGYVSAQGEKIVNGFRRP